MQKDILILAKSRKPNGYCVAGIELLENPSADYSTFGQWVRPVTPSGHNANNSDAIASHLCKDFGVLDIITVDLLKNTPTQAQPENWSAPRFDVNKVSQLKSVSALSSICDKQAAWKDITTRRDDQIRPEVASTCADTRSLMFIQPRKLSFKLENDVRGRHNVLASFSHGDEWYANLKVTDPAIERLFKNQFPSQRGSHKETTLRNRDKYWLTLSLTPVFHGLRYLLVAAIVDQTGYINRSYRC